MEIICIDNSSRDNTWENMRLTFNSKIAGPAIGLGARYYNELKVKNRFDGQMVFVTLSLGL